MDISRSAAVAMATIALIGTPAVAQTNDDIAALRRDMETLRQDYQARIDELEARLAQAEADASAARAAAEATPSTETIATVEPPLAPISAAATTNPNIYNPGIAVALNGFLTVARNDTGEESIAGFATGDEIGRPARGFSLGELEVSFAANIDPSLAGFLAISVDNADQIGLEEAYLRTTSLPGGLTLKAGRFLSSIGYLNERHAHDWSFSDAPLPYRAFLNSQLGDDGVQLRWIAPTDQYLEFGAEALRGEAHPAGGGANDGVGAYSAFVRTGADIDASSSYLAAASHICEPVGRPRHRRRSVHRQHRSRHSHLDLQMGAERKPARAQSHVWPSEIFYGRDEGAFNALPLSQSHWGWYAQGVYQFMPRWSAGLRVAGLQLGRPRRAVRGQRARRSRRTRRSTITALLEFDTSEFGRLRFQYARDESATSTPTTCSRCNTPSFTGPTAPTAIESEHHEAFLLSARRCRSPHSSPPRPTPT